MITSLARANHWPPQLVIDLAIGVEGTEEILERYGVLEEEYELLLLNPAFRVQLIEARKVVATEGLTFKKKAALLAELHLDTMSEMIDDPITPPATKLATFQALAKLGHLEPTKATDQANIMPTFNLVINI